MTEEAREQENVAVVQLATDRIDAGPFPWRTSRIYSRAEIDARKEAIQSAQGRITEPLRVRREGDRYTLLSGDLDLIAARALGLATVPALVVEMSDYEMALMQLRELVRPQAPPLVQGWALQQFVTLEEAPNGKAPSSRDLQRLLGTDGHTHFSEYMKFADRIPREKVEPVVDRLSENGIEVDPAVLVKGLTTPVLRKLTLLSEGTEFDALLYRVAATIAKGERAGPVLDQDPEVQREQARRASKRKGRKCKGKPVPALLSLRPGARAIRQPNGAIQWEHRGRINGRRVRWLSTHRAGTQLLKEFEAITRAHDRQRVARPKGGNAPATYDSLQWLKKLWRWISRFLGSTG